MANNGTEPGVRGSSKSSDNATNGTRQARPTGRRMIPRTDRRIVKRVVRTTRVSEQEAQRLNEIRRQAMEDFPPVKSPPGIPARIRAARRATQAIDKHPNGRQADSQQRFEDLLLDVIHRRLLLNRIRNDRHQLVDGVVPLFALGNAEFLWDDPVRTSVVKDVVFLMPIPSHTRFVFATRQPAASACSDSTCVAEDRLLPRVGLRIRFGYRPPQSVCLTTRP